MNVKLTARQKVKVVHADDLYKIMQQVLLRENKIRRAQEHFWIIGLNTDNKILFIELLALGARNRIMIKAPEVFRMAIYKMAVKAVLVHNHPGGHILPSKEDQAFTDKMLKAGGFLDIDVTDHLIISETDYTSFAQVGLMEKLRNSGAWELVDTSKAELNEMKMETERKKGVIQVAKKLKASGMSVEEIKKMTGLKVGEIREL